MATASREPNVRLHALQNSLASLRLRMGVLGADSTCRWAQGENIEALMRILNEAVQQTRELQAVLERPPRPPRAPARARKP
jgi:hypothetical protein